MISVQPLSQALEESVENYGDMIWDTCHNQLRIADQVKIFLNIELELAQVEWY